MPSYVVYVIRIRSETRSDFFRKQLREKIGMKVRIFIRLSQRTRANFLYRRQIVGRKGQVFIALKVSAFSVRFSLRIIVTDKKNQSVCAGHNTDKVDCKHNYQTPCQ